MAVLMEATMVGLEDFCREVRGPLVGALSLQVGRDGVAEELANDALIKLIEHWPSVSRMENPQGWVFTVAFNLARSRLRRLAAERRAHARVPRRAEIAHDATADPGIRAALRALPERQRQAVVCRYYLDLSIGEAAAVMDCAPNTVKVHLRTALAALRECGLQTEENIDD